MDADPHGRGDRPARRSRGHHPRAPRRREGLLLSIKTDIDVPLVRRLLAGQFPQWASLPIEPVSSSGTVNALYRLGDDLVVRLARVPSGAGDAEKEHDWLPRLAPLLPVPIPVALGEGTPTEDFPGHWGVYRWLDGQNPVEGRLSDPASLATDLAEFVIAMRRVDLPDGPPAYRGGPLALQDAGTRAAIEELGGRVDADAVTAAWEAALRRPSGPVRPCGSMPI